MKSLGLIAVALLVATLTEVMVLPSRAASTSVTVRVGAATTLDSSGCAAGQAGRTDFGAVLPGTAQVSSLDCVVTFGSNDAATTLQVAQFDRAGPAMYAPTDGQRDTTFSGDGVFSTAIGTGTAPDQIDTSVAMSDGSLVLVGTCDMGATGLDVCVVRMNRSGALDTTFAGDGILTLAIGPGASFDYGLNAVEVAGGKLLIASQCYSGTTLLDHCLVQLLPDGSLDPTFGTGGIELRDFTTNHEYIRGLHLLPDGSFLVAGDCEVPAGRHQCAARYLADGTLDTSFGTGGLVSHLPGGPGPVENTQLLVLADGSFVMGSACYIGAATDFDLCLARFRANGSLDTTFGSGGSAITAASTRYDRASTLVELDDGSILLGGHCDQTGPTGWNACFVRHASDGTRDLTFGSSGVAMISPSAGTGADFVHAIVDEGMGKFLVLGQCTNASSGDDFCVFRLNGDGTLDTTFGTAGVVMQPVAAGAGSDHVGHAMSLGDGQVLMAGACDMPTTGKDACAIVLDSAGFMAQYDPGTADWSTPGTGHFAACLLSTGTSTETWPTSATCPASNGTFWRALPAAATGAATAPSGTSNASANFRFGLRVASSQPPGSYVAPISFTVVGT